MRASSSRFFASSSSGSSATTHHSGERAAALVEDPPESPWLRRRLALGEQPVAPRAGLEDHVAGRVQRTEGPVEERLLDSRGGVARAAAESRAPHADGVDLVDEDDALAAPLARELLGLAGEPADDDRVHAQEGLLEPGARHQDEGAVEARGDRLREHRLSGPWSA